MSIVKTAKVLNKFGEPGRLKIQVVVPEFRVSYPNLFKPRNANPQDPTGKPKYGICMLWHIKDDEKISAYGVDLSILKQAVGEVRKDKWGTDQTKWPTLHLPFRKGDIPEKKGKSEYGPNVIFSNANASAEKKPWLLAPDKSNLTDPNQFYPGCFAVAKITVYAYEHSMKKGVTFGLDSVMKTRDGEPIVGKSDPLDDFASVGSTVAQESAPASDPLSDMP